MTLAIQIALCAALILSIFIPGLVFLKGERTKGRFKSALAINLFTFFGLLIIATVALFAGAAPTFADEAQAAAGSGLKEGLGYIAAALSTGISCLGLGKSLIYVGLAEGVCLYGLIISFMIIGQLG